MPLLVLLNKLNNPRSKKSTLPVVAKPKYVNEVKKLGNVKPLERPRLAVEIKPNTVVVDKTARDWRLCITAMLTKYPHYEFSCKVKSGELNKIKYWFKDTKANVTRVFSYKDMEDELHLSLHTTLRTKSQGFDPVEVKEEYVPSFSILDGIDLHNLLRIKYEIYMLKKYNSLHPFDTNINSIVQEKFDYTNHGLYE